LTGLP